MAKFPTVKDGDKMMNYRAMARQRRTFNNEMMIYFCQCDLRSNLLFFPASADNDDTAVEDYNNARAFLQISAGT